MAASRRPLSFLCALLVVVGVELATTSFAVGGATPPVTRPRRQGHQPQQEGARGLQRSRTTRPRKRSAEAGAGAVRQLGPRAAPDHGAHAHPLRRRGHRRLQAARGRHQAVQKALEIAARHQADEVARDARAAGRVRGGGAGGRQGRAAAARGNANAGGDNSGGGDNAGGGDNGGGEPTGRQRRRRGPPQAPAEAAARRRSPATTTTTTARTRAIRTKGTARRGRLLRPDHRLQRRRRQRQRAHEPACTSSRRPGFAVGQLGQIEPQLGFFVNPTTHALARRPLPVRERPQRREPLRPERQTVLQPARPAWARCWRARRS